MGSFYNPVSRPIAWNPLSLLDLSSSGRNVNRVSPVLKQLANLRVIVALIHTDVLRCITLWRRFLYRDAFQGWLRQLHVVSIRAVHDESDRYAVAFYQEAALCSRLPPVCRVWTCAFSPQEAPSSWLHPSPATSSQDASQRHTPPILSSISVGKRQPYTSLGNGREPCLVLQGFLEAPSIGIRFVERRR